MYKGRSDINLLVDSLSNGEKRHFNRINKEDFSSDNPPLYIDLYRGLEKGKGRLPKVFDALPAKTLTDTKRRLYDNILRSLRLLHGTLSIDILLQNQLSEIEILYQRGLSAQGLIILKRSSNMAKAHEKFALLLQILDWEKRLNIVLDKPTRKAEAVKQEEREVSQKLTQIMILERLYSQIMVFKREYGFIKGAIRRMVEQETVGSQEMPTRKACLSQKAIYYYNLIHAVYNWMTFDHREAFQYSKKLITQQVGSIVPEDYLSGIQQHITSCVCLAKFRDTLAGIDLGNAFIAEHQLTQSPRFVGQMFVYQAIYRLIVYSYMGDRKKLQDTIQATEAQLSQHADLLPLELQKIVLGNLMNAYMAIGDLDRADTLWFRLNEKHFKKIRQDVNGDLYLFRLFSLLQGKTYSLLSSASLSALRFYRKDTDAEKVFDFEMPIARLLHRNVDFEERAIRDATLVEIKAHVTAYIEALTGTLNFQEHYSRYVIWCKAILNDEPYYKAAQRWYKGYN